MRLCNSCEMPLEGWIYYEYNNFAVCVFCYNMLERKGDETE